ncbi:MAG: flagellar hook-basal body complex protein FliE [Myxococcales bacterium]|nr:flagellar hook-basal body complex protein FliE [Myxococcales bacterium]
MEGPRDVARPEDSGADFGQALSSAIAGVERAQAEADLESAKAAMGGGNLHELSIALEKADVVMRVATKVRNKVVDAYHEIMRMSV